MSFAPGGNQGRFRMVTADNTQRTSWIEAAEDTLEWEDIGRRSNQEFRCRNPDSQLRESNSTNSLPSVLGRTQAHKLAQTCHTCAYIPC